MAKRKLQDRLIHKDDINEDLCQIPNSINAYIGSHGNVYIQYEENQYLKKKLNLVYGYCYCGIPYMGRTNQLTKRVHRLVAEAFIPNPNHYPVVGHKNNIKNDNRVENLYWTTTQENTKKAFDDGLVHNDIGAADSQSVAVCAFDLDGRLLETYGSIGEASRARGMTKTGIIQQCEHRIKNTPRKGVFYRYQAEYDEFGFVL